MFDYDLFFEGKCLWCGRYWWLERFEGSGEVLSVHIRGFCFGVNNPNSILIFNSLKKKTARFVHCIENTTSNGSCLYWIYKNEKLLTMLTCCFALFVQDSRDLI